MALPPQGVGDQRDAITMALMGIANPPGKGQLPQGLPQNLSGGMSAIGNAIGGMGQPPQGAPMSLAPPAPGGMGQPAPPPMPPAPPNPGMPPPQGAPVGQMPQQPPMQGTGGLY